MIKDQHIDQAFSDLKATCGGVREDYFGLLYIEKEYEVPRDKSVNSIAFGGNDFGVDGFHFDRISGNLYIFQFKYSNSHHQFKDSLKRLINDGVVQIFSEPNKNNNKNKVLIQLRSCLLENRNTIQQVFFRFVFTGDPADAEKSEVLDHLREDLENKKYLVDQFFQDRVVGFVVDFRSASGRVGLTAAASHNAVLRIDLSQPSVISGPSNEKLYLGFASLSELQEIHASLGAKFFDRNIRYSLGDEGAVNRSIERSLRDIVIEESADPEVFAFHHNGITIFADRVEKSNDHYLLYSPRVLNGAQTISTVSNFRLRYQDHPNLKKNDSIYRNIRILCKIITEANQAFVTRVTINNNRQNPVEPWNLHANDPIQIELQEKFREDIGVYYERQENSFEQMSAEDLEESGITDDSKAIQLLKLTQTFLITDGTISRLSEIRRVFEDEKIYDQVFRATRLKADTRRIVICYKIHGRLRRLSDAILDKGVNKYSFISRARNLLWALSCQAVLNRPDIEDLLEKFGTNLVMPAEFTEALISMANSRVRPLLSALMEDKEYLDKVREDNLSFLRSDRAFQKCLSFAYEKWKWTHRKLQ